MLQIHTIVSKPFEENSYIVGLPGRRDVIVIDPGYEPELILDHLQGNELFVAAIVNTHGHCDHIAGNTAMKATYPAAPIVIGVNDAIMLTDEAANFGSMFGPAVVSPPADRTVVGGDRLEYAGVELDVLDIPGHSPGHVVYVWRGKPIIVLGGDVLFRGSVGRTDFPGGNFEQLATGIRGKLWALPDDTIIYPGHGPMTTIGHEKRTNPFVGAASLYPL